jgi:hypothetical protein
VSDGDGTKEGASARIGAHERQPHFARFFLVRQLDEDSEGPFHGKRVYAFPP